MRADQLPNGKMTRSVQKYVRAWEALARPVCRATGWELHGFNPTCAFRTSPPDGPILSLNIDQVNALVLAFDKIREQEREKMKRRALKFITDIAGFYSPSDFKSGSTIHEALGCVLSNRPRGSR